MDDQYLKYNDNIFILSNQQPPRYLSGRSILEGKVYMLQLLDEQGSKSNIIYYDNFQECIFKIVPKQYYHAFKNQQKALNDKNTKQEKNKILKSRVQNEKEQNQQILNYHKSQPIKIGDIILIQHVISGCYIKFSTELNEDSMAKYGKNKNQPHIFNVILSQNIDSRTLFKIKIDPQLAFKKDGEYLNKEDSFYFESVKNQQNFSFETQTDLNLEYQLNQKFKDNNYISFPSIMERSMAFKIYQAVHVSKNQNSTSTFKVIYIENNDRSNVNDENSNIFYGDFIRLTHLLKEKKVLSYLNYEINITGTCPYPVMTEDKDSVCSIFQIIPDQHEKLGSQILFQNQQSNNAKHGFQSQNQQEPTHLLLRHWLTGKYMNVYIKSNSISKMSDSLDEFIYNNDLQKQLKEVQQTIQLNNLQKNKQKKREEEIKEIKKNILLNFKSQLLNTALKDNQEFQHITKNSKSNEQYQEELQQQQNKQQEQQQKDGYSKEVLKFIQNNLLNLQPFKNDEKYITNESKFFIENCYPGDDDGVEHMQVLKEPLIPQFISTNLKKSNKGWLEEGVNFEGIYLNIAIKKQLLYQVQSSTDETKDYFNFQVVDNQEILFVSSLLSRIHPLIVLSCNPTILTEEKCTSYPKNYIFKSNQSLLKICYWLCDQHDFILFEQLITMKVNQVKQRIIRQVGLIDIVIKIFYHLKESNIFHDSIIKNGNLFQLSIIIINFLRLSAQNNYLNSFYVFQWYQMMKNILLHNDNLPSQLHIDKLLLQLFNQTKVNQSEIFQDDMKLISSSLEFEKLNKQAQNLLLCFCNNNQEQGIVDKNQQEKIIQELLIKNSNKLFKDFIYNNQLNKLTIQLDNQLIEIDSNLQINNTLIFDYIQANLQLICEISKKDVNLVIKYIKQLCPFQTCIQVFNNKTIPSNIRAIFMNIFLESFIKYDSRYIADMDYPYLIVLQKDLKLNQKGCMFDQRKFFKQKYSNQNNLNQAMSLDVTNLKDHILQQLLNLVTKDIFDLKQEDNINISSLIEINYYLLKKNFFTVNEMGKLHILYDDLIKNTYTYLICKQIQEQNSDQSITYDIESSFLFLNNILDCLYYIELQEQNEMLEQFFTIQQGEQIYSKNSEDLLMENKSKKFNELKNDWSEQLEERKEIIQKYMECLEIPNTEVIYYYFKMMDLNNNQITLSIIRLIFQIFNMRQNMFTNFNNLIFINQKNYEIYDIFSENFDQLKINLVDILNEDKSTEQMKQIYMSIDNALDNIAQNIFEDYILKKNEQYNDIFIFDQNQDKDEKQHSIDENKNFLKGFQHNSIQESKQNLILNEQQESVNNIDNNKQKQIIPEQNQQQNDIQEENYQKPNEQDNQQNKTNKFEQNMPKMFAAANTIQLSNRLKQIEQQDQMASDNFFLWEIVDNNKFDIRITYQKQEMLRKINGHKILMKLISQIALQKMDKNSKQKQQVLKTSFNILIFFCIKNQKNQNTLASDKNCLQFIKDILKIQKNDIQIYVMMFIAELFKDNYQLLINLKQNQEQLLQEISQIFIKIYENKNNEIIQIDYCIYYIQLLYSLFSVNGTILLQNQVWIFKLTKENHIYKISKDLLEYSKNVKVQLQNQNDAIQIPDKLVLFTCLLNLIGKLYVNDSKNSELILLSKKYISLVDISQSLEDLGDWYFLKQEFMSFLKKIYITNNKLSQEEEIELLHLFKEPIYDEIIRFIEKSKIFQNEQKYFISNQKNILQIITSYSTKTHAINQKINTCHDYYMLFGILDCLLAYFDRFFTVNSKHIKKEQNIQFLQKYITSMELLYSLWSDENNDDQNKNNDDQNKQFHAQQKQFKAKQIKKFLNESNSYLTKSIFLNAKDTFQTYSTFKQILTKDEKLEENMQVSLGQMRQTLKNIYSSDRCLILCKQQNQYKNELLKVEQAWDNILSMITDSVDQDTIENEHHQEMDILIGLMIKMREKDAQSFKSAVKNMINLLIDESLDCLIKDQCIQILRHLGNFNDHPEIAKEVKKDLCELNFTKYLCQVISRQDISQSSRYKYILTLVDFLDEGEEVQKSLQEFCSGDKENIFMNSIYNFILNNFNDFKEYEKGLQQRISSGISKKDQVFDQLREVIDNKIEFCNRGIWLLKMACEGHFGDMQNFLREQINFQKKLLPQNINMISFGADLFCQYIAISDSSNAIFGEYLLDFLIEVIQGPCLQNQIFLSQTKILGVLEDLMLSLVPIDEEAMYILRVRDVAMGSYTKRIYIFLLSMFEGSDDIELLEKIQSFIDPLVLFKRLMYIYKNVVSESKNDIQKKLMIKLNGHDDEAEKEKEFNNQKIGQDKNQKDSQQAHPFSKNIIKTLFWSSKQRPQISQPEQNEDKIVEENEQLLLQKSNYQETQKYTIEGVDEEFGEKIEDLKEEANQIFILLRLLSFKNSTFKQRIEKSKIEFKSYLENLQSNQLSLYKNTMNYYKMNTGRIEIINDQDDIQILFFAKPDLSKYLSESTKENFLENVERTQPNDKIKGLLIKVNDFIDEMNHYKFIMTNIQVDLDYLFTLFRWIVLFCAFVINFMIIADRFTEECSQCEGKSPITYPCVCSLNDTKTMLGQAINLFGFVIFAFNIFNFVLWVLLKLKLDILNAFNSFDNMMKEQKKLEQFQPKSAALLAMPTEVIKTMEFMKEFMEQNVYRYVFVFQYLALNSYFLYLSGYAFFTILGIILSRIFFTFLLLDIVERSLMLQNILKSVSKNQFQLMMMGLLGFVIMYIYAMLGFYNVTLHKTMKMLQQKTPICINQFNCFLFAINLGFRSGGGIGEPLIQPDPYQTEQFTMRFFYDLTFFIIISVIWMNVIFGIIIDTFAELREDKNEQDMERKNNCFICSLDKIQFEKRGIFFEQHTENEHNTWNYFLYIVHLKLKDPIDYSGVESFIFDKYEEDDISWFPIGKSLSLQEFSQKEDKDIFLEKIQNIGESLRQILQFSQEQSDLTAHLQTKKNIDEDIDQIQN